MYVHGARGRQINIHAALSAPFCPFLATRDIFYSFSDLVWASLHIHAWSVDSVRARKENVMSDWLVALSPISVIRREASSRAVRQKYGQVKETEKWNMGWATKIASHLVTNEWAPAR